MPRPLIVSHRLPVSAREERGRLRLLPAVGALATALRSVHEGADGRWIGWIDDLAAAPEGARAALEAQLRAERMVPVPLAAREVGQSLHDFSNGVLRPLLHQQIDRVSADAEPSFQVYKRVNRRFAEAIVAEYRPGDLAWVQGYELALVPGYLRAALPEARIAFSLHAPFPPPEVFRRLPWREEVIRGILGADVVGFEAPLHRDNFAHAAFFVLGLDLAIDILDVFGRPVRIGVYPIRLDAFA